MLLTDREKRVLAEDVRDLIVADATTCRVLRPVVAGEGSFNGPREASETVVTEALAIEFLAGSPEEVTQEGSDATGNVAADAEVRENDFVVVDDVRYRVTNVEAHRAFGARSHKTLTLEREYRGDR